MLILTKQLLEIPRNPINLLAWARNTIEEMGGSAEGTHAIRFTEGLAKPLVEELLPLGLFAVQHFGPVTDITIEPTIGDQNYDAMIHDHNNRSSFQYIEVTQAHEGEDHKLRMQYLEEHGGVSLTSPIKKTGNKFMGIQVEQQPGSSSPEDQRSIEIKRIQGALQKKSKKQYPDQTVLVIVFQDVPAFTEKENISRLKQSIEGDVYPLFTKFPLIALVGWYGRQYFEFDSANS